MSAQKLQDFLDSENIEASIIKMEAPTPTVPSAAQLLGIEVDQVIKSLVFETPLGPVLVIGCGLGKVDTKLLAEALDCSKRKTKFARAERALEITGFVVGSMPPFGHLTTLPTYIDPKVLQHEVLYGGGGDIDAMMRVTKAELLRVANAKVVQLLV